MNIFDFDKTLYRSDSTLDFTLQCAWRHQRVLTTLPQTMRAAVRWKRKQIAITDFKATLYRYLPLVPDIEAEVERFWQRHEANITGPCSAEPGDLIISASPEFLLKGLCERRGWRLIASQVDPHSGRVLGPNCSKEQKVVRFRQEYPDARVDAFYSDSLNDTPMARLAAHAYLVKDGALHPWPTAPSRDPGNTLP